MKTLSQVQEDATGEEEAPSEDSGCAPPRARPGKPKLDLGSLGLKTLSDFQFPEKPKYVREEHFDYASIYRMYVDFNPPSKCDIRYWSSNSFPWSPHIHTLNHKVFGNTSFKVLQEEAINATMAGKHVIANLPTSGGKSLIYQLPALTDKGVTLVITPLKALIQDQIRILNSFGIPAASTYVAKPSVLLKELQKDDINLKILFFTAEKVVKNRAFVDALKMMYNNGNIQRIVVDEAHCISEWGHDFRKDYRKLGFLANLFPEVPFLALTGSCTPKVREDIQVQLKMKDAVSFQGRLERENIRLLVKKRRDDVDTQIVKFLNSEELIGKPGLIYCMTCGDAENLCAKLRSHNLSVSYYHSRLNNKQRNQVQALWTSNKISILCTTVAFGMGIDKQNVHFVIHTAIPHSIEAYYQQIGRAGRGIDSAVALLLYQPADRARLLQVIRSGEDESGTDSNLLNFRTEKLDDVEGYFNDMGCRHSFIYNYFGQNYVCDPSKGKCDRCGQVKDSKSQEVKTK
eukprot:TRINITY_DN2497_c0_g1_i1.p1 TRINITY_DN2497_c0_g1~~TRINITY_DN2497_c0_g1_i1.p1  ORF type:complete len:577 (-),score=113.35 TRINITY_DN2497_c0_g1_i1:13-1557(-)